MLANPPPMTDAEFYLLTRGDAAFAKARRIRHVRVLSRLVTFGLVYMAARFEWSYLEAMVAAVPEIVCLVLDAMTRRWWFVYRLTRDAALVHNAFQSPLVVALRDMLDERLSAKDRDVSKAESLRSGRAPYFDNLSDVGAARILGNCQESLHYKKTLVRHQFMGLASRMAVYASAWFILLVLCVSLPDPVRVPAAQILLITVSLICLTDWLKDLLEMFALVPLIREQAARVALIKKDGAGPDDSGNYQAVTVLAATAALCPGVDPGVYDRHATVIQASLPRP